MLFPNTPRVVYETNVLEEVICQLRFPPILRIGVEPPVAFQERIRKKYPLYVQDTGSPRLPKQISDMLEEMRIPNPLASGGSVRHKFSTSDDQRSVFITTEFLALSETNYQRWEDFCSEVKFVESEFKAEYETEFYTRIGLRYQDRITRSELRLSEVGWHELLNSELTGLLGNERFANVIRHDRTEVELEIPKVEDGRLHLRLGLAPLKGSTEMSYIIDADIYTPRRCTTDDAFQLLDNFHTTAGNFFRWAILGKLRDALGPLELGGIE